MHILETTVIVVFIGSYIIKLNLLCIDINLSLFLIFTLNK